MNDNIGKIVKALGKAILRLGITLCVIIAVFVLAFAQNIFAAIIIVIAGILFSVVTSILVYGFGELICNVKQIEENIRKLYIFELDKAARQKKDDSQTSK